MIKIYNTQTKIKEEFKPIIPGEIGIYVCGVTVYDYCHLGHAKTYIAFDAIVNYLRYRYPDAKVKFVRNITDIDDKIINKAKETHSPWEDITDKYITAMHEDFNALGAIAPDAEPRATDFMPQMLELIKKLIAKGTAYIGENGDVYYDVHKHPNYGCVSGRKLEALQAGARVDINEAKHNPLDFVLWKMSKPGEPYWESPWGHGRPGWHLECSAMSMHYLGETFDIHGGGFDLIFPHHENECAQSEAANGKKFVNIWMHVGFLQINKEKMSKSLGNFFTIRDVLQVYNPEVLRYFLLSSHYRSQSDYSIAQLDLAKGALERFYIAIRDITPNLNFATAADDKVYKVYKARFLAAMDDDFNTPEALAVLFDLAKHINIAKAERSNTKLWQEASTLAGLLQHLAAILGLLQQDPEKFLQGYNPYHIKIANELSQAEIEELIMRRNQARKVKDWDAADKWRKQLEAKGIILEDTAGGTTWRAVSVAASVGTTRHAAAAASVAASDSASSTTPKVNKPKKPKKIKRDKPTGIPPAGGAA